MPGQKRSGCGFPEEISRRGLIELNEVDSNWAAPRDESCPSPSRTSTSTRHDAWIVGDESCVVIDWQGFADYAKGH